VKFIIPKVLAALALIGISSCSSHFSSDKSTNAAATPLTAQQKKEALAKVAPHLQGEWVCSGSTANFFGCYGETLTFSAALDQLTIKTYLAQTNCQMTTTYQLTMGMEDSEGMTDFSIHDTGLGQLTNGSDANADCINFVSTQMTNKPLDENFSFTHTADWSKITIGDNTFQKSPDSQPSAAPSAQASPSPSSSNHLSNS
jgi:hypothetical protein